MTDLEGQTRTPSVGEGPRVGRGAGQNLFMQQRRPKGPSESLICAIVELKSRNPRFGARGLRASSRRRSGSTSTRTSCTAWLAKRYRSARGGTGPSWLSFVGHTTDSLWRVDLFRCASIVLQSSWGLVVMAQFTRRLVGFGVHRGSVDAPSLCRMCNAAIHGRGAPRHLSTDHDPLFEAHRWDREPSLLEIDEIKTVPHVPLSHPCVERLIGTLRREFLDHVLCWNAGDLERKLADFQAYDNAARSHASLEGDTPLGFAGERTAARAEFNHVRWISTARAWSSFQRRPDDEFETDRQIRGRHRYRRSERLHARARGNSEQVGESTHQPVSRSRTAGSAVARSEVPLRLRIASIGQGGKARWQKR